MMRGTQNRDGESEELEPTSVLPDKNGVLARVGHLLTAEEVAKHLRVTAEQVRCLIRRGQLKAMNVGTGSKRPLYRITAEALHEFLSARFQDGPAVRLNRVKRHPPTPDRFPDLR
jgi:excisionase family DNA binding protein